MTAREAPAKMAGENAAGSLLWVDLRRHSSLDAFDDIAGALPAYKVEAGPDIGEEIARRRALLLCFDYDWPDRAGLQALQDTKRRHGRLPVVMLTAHHSEDLAIWALRNRVWDYVLKPIAPQELRSMLRELLQVCAGCRSAMPRCNLHRPQPIPIEHGMRLDEGPPLPRTGVAVKYVETHCHEPIALDTVASICHLSVSRFSHVFRAEHGVPFGVFVQRHRLARARELLVRSTAPVKDICFSVGFNDPAYFCRAFRARWGTSPGTYRARAVALPTPGS